MTRPNSPNVEAGPSEMSWGKGLQPKWAENLPPDQGGVYSGKTPPEEFYPTPNTPFTGAS